MWMPSPLWLGLGLLLVGGVAEYSLQWTLPSHRPSAIVPPSDPDQWIQNVQGLWLYTQRWEPADRATPRAVLLLLPGYGEHCDRPGYHHFAAHMTGAGYAVVAMDHQGLGRSNGDRGFVHRFGDYVDDFRRLLDTVRLRWPQTPTVAVGHDLGGGVAVLAALHSEPLAALVLSAPLVRPDPDLSTPFVQFVYRLLSFAPRMTIDRREHARLRRFCRNATALKLYVADPLTLLGVPLATARQILDAGARIQANASRLQTPTLVLHVAADSMSKPDGSAAFVDAIGTPADAKGLILYDGALHDLFEEDTRDQMARDVLDFLDRVLPRPPPAPL